MYPGGGAAYFPGLRSHHDAASEIRKAMTMTTRRPLMRMGRGDFHIGLALA
jgi:hypothetical protein